MKKTIIGLVGEKGSGKETFGDLLIKLLPEKKILRIRSSDILSESLELWEIEKTRENLQDLAIIMDNHFGKGTLSKAVKKRIEGMDADIVIFDGVRWDSDVELIRSFPENYIIYVTANLDIRFKRIKNRKEKAFEEGTTMDQFMHEEKKLTELQIPKIGETADFKLENNSNLDELKRQVNTFCQKLILQESNPSKG